MFHEASLFRPWITKVLEEDLAQAKEDNRIAGDRRDSDGCVEAWAKIRYIEGLLKKAQAFHIT